VVERERDKGGKENEETEIDDERKKKKKIGETLTNPATPNSSETTSSDTNPSNRVRIRVSGSVGVDGFGNPEEDRGLTCRNRMSRVEEKGNSERTGVVNPNILIDRPILLLVPVKPEHGLGDK
jgi:hypothetical protein